MAEIPLPEQQARAYLKIAHRQLAMAEALLKRDLYEHTGLKSRCWAGLDQWASDPSTACLRRCVLKCGGDQLATRA